MLLFDGVFLQRRELRGHWDLRVFVDVTPDVAFPSSMAHIGADEVVNQQDHSMGFIAVGVGELPRDVQPGIGELIFDIGQRVVAVPLPTRPKRSS